jgi:3-deoxy-D-manno-octulosonic-acid transferase
VVIVESELWPNFIAGASRRGIPVAVLNGKMSEKSRRAYACTRIVPRALAGVALLAVQSAEHAARFLALGVPAARVHVTGNMKYDLTVETARDEREAMRRRLGYAEQEVVVIGGSLHPGEPEALVEAFLALELRVLAALILVPRYPVDAGAIAVGLEKQGLRAVRKTQLDHGETAPPGRRSPSDAARPDASHGRAAVLVVDTVGELGRLYSAADVAFVGGSLFFRGSNKGGHNLMEPAIRGVATLFGPYNFSFKETVKDLLRADAAVEVADAAALRGALAALGADPERRTALGERGRRVVLQGRGATDRNYALLAPLLEPFESAVECLQGPADERTMPRASGKLDS